MAKFLGNAATLSVESAPDSGTFGIIEGVTEHVFNRTSEDVDVSDKDSNRWGEILNAGRRAATITMTGFANDGSNYAIFAAAITNDSIIRYKYEYEGGSREFTGLFKASGNDQGAPYNNAETFNVTLTLVGEPETDT